MSYVPQDPLFDLVMSLSEDIDSRLVKLVNEASEHRESVKGGRAQDTPSELHESLLRSRAAMDRVEVIVGGLSRLAARTGRVVEDCLANLEDAEARLVADKGPSRVDDFSSAKEKNARINAGTIEEKMAWRKARRVHEDVESALNYCKLLHRGLDSSRKDIDTRIRLMSIEGRLES